MQAVNAVGSEYCTVAKLKRKWSYVSQTSRKGLPIAKAEGRTASGTGVEELTPFEQRVAAVVGDAAQSGVETAGEVDTDVTPDPGEGKRSISLNCPNHLSFVRFSFFFQLKAAFQKATLDSIANLRPIVYKKHRFSCICISEMYLFFIMSFTSQHPLTPRPHQLGKYVSTPQTPLSQLLFPVCQVFFQPS